MFVNILKIHDYINMSNESHENEIDFLNTLNIDIIKFLNLNVKHNANELNIIRNLYFDIKNNSIKLYEKTQKIIDDINKNDQDNCEHHLINTGEYDPCRTIWRCTKCHKIC